MHVVPKTILPIRYLELIVGDRVFIRVASYNHIMRFRRNSKLVSRFINPFEILEWIGKVVYRRTLLVNIDCIHNVFYVLLLCKHIRDLSHELKINEIELTDNLSYKEKSV